MMYTLISLMKTQEVKMVWINNKTLHYQKMESQLKYLWEFLRVMVFQVPLKPQMLPLIKEMIRM